MFMNKINLTKHFCTFILLSGTLFAQIFCSEISGVRRIHFSRGRNTFEGGQKKNQGGQTRARRARKNCLPPLFSFLPPRQNSFLPPGRIHFCPPCRIRFCPRGRTDKRGGGGRIPYYT